MAQALRLGDSQLPVPLCTSEADLKPRLHPVHLGPELFRVAQDLLASRSHFAASVRRPYIESRCLELQCLLAQQLQDAQTQRTVMTRFGARDVRRIYEARDILVQNFASPPSIPRLARAVGVNQTKLKAGFKEILGCTVFEFVQQRRMERASELLLKGHLSIGEIARMVGYEYPANFTFAFRRHYGFLPKLMKRGH